MSLPAEHENQPKAYDGEQIINGPWADVDLKADLSQPGREVPQSRDIREAVTRRALEQAFRDERLTMDDLLTQRSVVCWRVLRYLATVVGHPAGQGPIEYLFKASHPFQPLVADGPAPSDAWNLPPKVYQIAREWVENPLPLVLDKSATAAQREQYCRALTACAEALGVPKGSPDNLQLGRYGMAFLIDPDQVVDALPTPYHLVAFERKAAEEIMETLQGRGEWESIKIMRARFALSDGECAILLDKARELSLAITRCTDDERRALLQMRLDDTYEKANGDPRVQLGAIKVAAQIHGLTKGGGAEDPFDNDLDALNTVIEEGQDEAMQALGLDE